MTATLVSWLEADLIDQRVFWRLEKRRAGRGWYYRYTGTVFVFPAEFTSLCSLQRILRFHGKQYAINTHSRKEKTQTIAFI